MMEEKRLFLLFLVFFLILAFNVNALPNLEVNKQAVTDFISPVQKAEYNLIITNKGNTDTFIINYFDLAWRVQTNPDEFTLKNDANISVNVVIIPIGEKSGGVYSPYLTIARKSNPKDAINTNLVINVINYDDLLDTKLVIPDEFDPRKKGLFKVDLENQRDIEIDDVTVKVESDFINQEQVINVGKKETKEVNFEVQFNEDTKQGEYPLKVSVLYNDNVVKEYDTNLVIGSYEDVKEIESPENSFLKTKYEVTKTNNGNVDIHETLSVTVNSKLFTKTNVKPNSINKVEGGWRYIWEFDLSPGETRNIVVETNYRGFTIGVIIIVLIGLGLWLYFRRDLTVVKKVVKLKQEKDGTSNMKVVIILKNKGLKKLNEVKLMDTMAHLAEAPAEFGTLQPKKIDRSKDGIRVVWILGTLARGEERIISYNVRMRVHIIGKVFIHRAIAKYRVGKSVKSVSSNIVSLFTK